MMKKRTDSQGAISGVLSLWISIKTLHTCSAALNRFGAHSKPSRSFGTISAETAEAYRISQNKGLPHLHRTSRIRDESSSQSSE
jgi:hypothetical protein